MVKVVSCALAVAACGLSSDQGPLPAPVPPGHALAYVSQGLANQDDIFLLSADATSDVNLTTNNAYDSWPAWSPDGLTLAFESDRDDIHHTDIYVLTLSSGAVSRLTADTAHHDGQPAWSPLGNRIAFVSDRDSAGFDIYLMDVNGTNVKRLTTDVANSAEPAWSPDGSKIAFANDSGGPVGVGDIYVVDTSGAGKVNLTHHPASDLTPAWSPDGTKIAFMSDRDAGGFAIWVMSADGSNPVRVSPTTPCGVPSWTPDGQRLAFECDADVWVANADGTGLQQITRTPNDRRSEVMPRWQP